MDSFLLSLLRCPITGEPLQVAPPALMERVNRATQQDRLRNRQGEAVQSQLDEGLVERSHRWLWPVRDSIVRLVVEEAISLDQVGLAPENAQAAVSGTSHVLACQGNTMAEKTVFKKIVEREIPAEIVYEDDYCLAFRDIDPQAPVHLLIIPKQEIATLDDLTEQDVEVAGRILLAAHRVARQLGLSAGYRLVCNTGPEAGQIVQHVHFHLLAGRPMQWPPG